MKLYTEDLPEEAKVVFEYLSCDDWDYVIVGDVEEAIDAYYVADKLAPYRGEAIIIKDKVYAVAYHG